MINIVPFRSRIRTVCWAARWRVGSSHWAGQDWPSYWTRPVLPGRISVRVSPKVASKDLDGGLGLMKDRERANRSSDRITQRATWSPLDRTVVVGATAIALTPITRAINEVGMTASTRQRRMPTRSQMIMESAISEIEGSQPTKLCQVGNHSV